MTQSIDQKVAAWTRAEREGDAQALDGLLHPDFLAVGPYGFLLHRKQWLERFGHGLAYSAFEFTPDAPTRYVGGNAFVVGTQAQEGMHRAQPIEGSFRVTLVFAEDDDWQLVAMHLSLRNPPGAPS
ncbi:nuclear transport factor 2 family protein [Streptomyces sp. NPDC048172]|uniref:nuclear transport factor 2 family protein n=1 Tax=Streptomyces sp. NPDC048172 TaxID=3365505 RepID=UPI0037189945